MAYLTSTTGTVTNTFTVGKVEITLDEAPTDAYGVADTSADRITTGNKYKLIPGHSYTKDPIITVKADSEPCYVFVKVVDGLANIEADTTIAAQITANGWAALAGVDNVYYKTQAAVTADTELHVFGSFTLKSDAAVANYASATIAITGYAIQSDGFSSAAAAWNAGGFGGTATVPTNG